jgi:hypothetical protein
MSADPAVGVNVSRRNTPEIARFADFHLPLSRNVNLITHDGLSPPSPRWGGPGWGVVALQTHQPLAVRPPFREISLASCRLLRVPRQRVPISGTADTIRFLPELIKTAGADFDKAKGEEICAWNSIETTISRWA